MPPTLLAPRLRRALAYSLALTGCFNPEGNEVTDSGPSSASSTSPETTVDPNTSTTSSTDPTTGGSTTSDDVTSTMGSMSATTEPPDTTGGFDCAQCVAPTPKCDGQACFECLGDGDCTQPGEGVCDPAGRFCRPCLRHSDCELACELDVGTCFPKNDTVVVDAVTEAGCAYESCTDNTLCCSADAAIKRGLTLGTNYVVVRLSHDSAPTDVFTIVVNEDSGAAGKRIALLGAPEKSTIVADIDISPVIFLGTFAMPAPPLTAKMYVSHLRITGGAGVWCQRAQHIWVDDSVVFDNDNGPGIDASECTFTVERSVVVDNSGGVAASKGAHLRLFNTIIGGSPNLHELQARTSGVIDGVYVTIADEPTQSARTVECDASAVVRLRNAIVAAAPPEAPVDCSGMLTIDNSLVAPVMLDTEGQGNLGVVNAADLPFKDWPGHDFRLDINKNVAPLAEIAVWTQGDPATDIDGAPRPTVAGTKDYPGADIPQ